MQIFLHCTKIIPTVFIPDQNLSIINRDHAQKALLMFHMLGQEFRNCVDTHRHVIQQESSSEDNRLWTKPEYVIIYMLTQVLWSRLLLFIWNYDDIRGSYQCATDAPKCIVLRCHRFRCVGCCVKLVVQFSFCKAKRTSIKCQQEKNYPCIAWALA